MSRLKLLALLWAALPLAAQPQIANCPIFPLQNIWNTRVDKLPVHYASSRMIQTEGADTPVVADFVIPFVVVPQDQPKLNVQIDSDESDPGPYPIPPNPPIEADDDKHILIVTRGECKLYELDVAELINGVWHAYSAAIFDLRSNLLRPDGWTSSDAAGLPVFPGLVRYDEVASGVIRHALRVTVPKTRNTYVWPARHYASHLDGEEYPAMGQRFRLKASFDISGFHPQVQVILQALKTYGMMIADNGDAWLVTGAPDPRWDQKILAQLQRVHGSDLEAVDATSLQGAYDSGLAVDPNASNRVNVDFSASPVFDLSLGTTQSITLTGEVTGAQIVNVPDGQTISFLICQDLTGGRSFVWPANVLGGMRIGTVSGTCSAQTFVSDGTKLYATSPGMTNM